jgi:hypothetical protein
MQLNLGLIAVANVFLKVSIEEPRSERGNGEEARYIVTKMASRLSHREKK